MKAEVTRDSDPDMVGKLAANAPRRSASLWTTYDFAGPAQGLPVGHVAQERPGGSAGSRECLALLDGQGLEVGLELVHGRILHRLMYLSNII